MIGETVGNYRIVKLLGEGGMGVVYEAEHPGIGRKAAVKMLHPHLAQSQELVTRFFNEARAANAIRHPGIVEAFDFGTLASGASYIIMEFLEGESLSARIKRPGHLSLADAIDLAAQTANVLGAAHAKGIVHRDLKPDNIFVVPDFQTPGRERIKVLDFGIAKLTMSSGGPGSVKTRTGTVMGTPLYMSPEQCLGTREVDQRTDIYALGIILYEMLCGRPPFVSEGHGELIHMHIASTPTPPRQINPGIPVALEQVVLRAIMKEPERRFQTMGDLEEALRGGSTEAAARVFAVAARQTKLLRSTPPTKTTFSTAAALAVVDQPANERRGARWGALAALGGLVAVAAGALFIFKGGNLGNGGKQPVNEGPPPNAATQSMPTPPAMPVAEPSKPVPAVVEKVDVSITSEPRGARVVRERDGAAIGVTPFKESWPAGGGVEKLVLELDGYRDERFGVPLDRGVALTFALTKTEAPAAHKKKGHDSGAHPAPPARSHDAPAVPPAAEPPAMKASPKKEPIPL
jgi:eukaryotic-like serine/threonine-protein kinase